MTQDNELHLTFGEWQMPLDITSVAVDTEGQLVHADRRDFKFRFRYRDINFSVHFQGDDKKAGAHIGAPLGVLPFSAESAALRQTLNEILGAAKKDLGVKIIVAQNKIHLAADIPVRTPVTAVGMVADLTKFLLPLKPYLELMAMVRMALSCSA